MGNTPSIKDYDRLRKAACLFAGLGHLQPLLLATTNSHYLLDRFCMERCCSSEYVSRIVTSIIFMEILAIIVVRIVLYIACNPNSWSSPGELVGWTRHKEEPIRDYISTIILWAIFFGYMQILISFMTGGKKGHMHWFYASLLIQHFLNSLIAGSIGFWEVGLALWYLVTLPMAPIPVFFYQLMIHSWIRNNGPRDPEYIIVECQIWLAICLSCIATAFWTAGYVLPHIPPEEAELNLATPGTPTTGSITAKEVTRILQVYTVSTGGTTTKTATISAKSGESVKVTIKSITVTLNGGTPTPNPVIVYPRIKLIGTQSGGSATVIASLEGDNSKNEVTIKIENTKGGTPLYEEEVKVTKASGITNIALALEPNGNIEVKKVGGDGRAEQAATVQVTGYTCYPNNRYYISGLSSASAANSVIGNLWNSKWAGGKCFYAEYYKNNSNTIHALLKLHIINGGSPGIKYYGTKDGIASGNTWKVIPNEAKFREYVKELIGTGYLATLANGSPASNPNSGDNTNFGNVLGENWSWWPSSWKPNKLTPTWLPLIMQGLSVGAVGSIFPNLIPKTLTCPKTTRNLSVVNMFLVTVPHIINLALAENDCLLPANPWADWDKNTVWPCSLLLYLFYILAILFAIFNVHYPEWTLSSFLRNNTWFVFLMILFTDVLNETFNAISRAGICSQKAAGGGDKKNHPCLHNKIACLMNLTYIPFWSSIL